MTALSNRPLSIVDRWFPAASIGWRGVALLLMIFAVSACTSDIETDSSDTETVAEDVELDANPTGVTPVGNTPVVNVRVARDSVLPAGLIITDYELVTSVRSGRTTKEYMLKIKIANTGSTSYDNVMATLQSVPGHVNILGDGKVLIGDIPANSTLVSKDTFLIELDLSFNTGFDDLGWFVEADVGEPPSPPTRPTPQATGIFMKIDDPDIPGEVEVESHQDWIELISFSDGLRRVGGAATGSSRARSRFEFDGVMAVKDIDQTAPKLREAIAKGTIFGEVKIDIVKSCGVGNYYTAYAITLTPATITMLSLAANEFDTPTESVGFEYTRITTLYTPVDRDCRIYPPIFSTQDGELLPMP